MSIKIQNLRISPYCQKDTLKAVFGDTMELTFTIPHVDGESFMCGLDNERVVYPPSRPICAYTSAFTRDGDDVTFRLKLTTSKLRDFVSTIRKPMPVWLQIVREVNGKYETILLDDILALPSVIDGAMTVCEGDPLKELLEAKMDKPAEEGTAGQVLTMDNDGHYAWADLPEIPEQEQANWDESDSSDVSYIQNKPVIPTVNDATVTINQGGVQKGTFTLNQSGNATIDLNDGAQADWDESDSSDVAYIRNKPVIPTVNDATVTINQGGVQKGTFTLNQSTGATINLNDGAQSNWDESDSTDVSYIQNKPVLPDFVAIEKKLDDYETMLNKHVLTHTPLCIEAVAGQAGVVSIYRTNNGYAFDLEYSWDNETWAPLEWDGNNAKYRDANNNLQNIILYYNNPSYPTNKVYLRGNNPAGYMSAYSNCNLRIGAGNDNISFKACGNAMSLLYKSGYADVKLAPAQAFNGLFLNNAKLVDAGDLILSATTLGMSAYSGMFYNCQNLVTAPELPATTLGNGCYGYMFNTCVNLTSIRVAFTSWGSNNSQYTLGWTENAGGYVDNPVFYCPSALDATNIGNNGIPSHWTVVRI